MIAGMMYGGIAAFSQWSDNGNNYSSGSLYIGSSADSTYSSFTLRGPNEPFYEGSKRDMIFSFERAGKSIIRSYRGNGWGTYLQLITTSHENANPVQHVRMHIGEDGKVGIGTTTPAHTLTVKGTVHARDVLLEITAGADFVFHPGHDLQPLSEVKSFIQENRHLPGIPSEREMKENGVTMSEFQIKLLEKIEELTLHSIRQEEKITALEKQLEQYRTALEK